MLPTSRVRAQSSIAGVPATAELVSLHGAVTPGEPLLAGVLITAEDGWHTYWINPGDSGLATSIDWELPDGVTAGPIQWPYPRYFETGGIAGFGYEGKVLLPVSIDVPGTLSGPSLTLRATVKLLACKEECIPGKYELELTLPVMVVGSGSEDVPGAGVGVDPKHEAAFKQAMAEQPVEMEAGRISATSDGKMVTLLVRGVDVGVARYFPIMESEIDAGPRQQVARTAEGLTITLKPSPYHDGPIERLLGVLVFGQPVVVTPETAPEDSAEAPQTEPATAMEPTPEASSEAGARVSALMIDTPVELIER